eukprot:9099374-Karenia_brevis.AAC.1
MHAGPHNALIHGRYYCDDCQCPECRNSGQSWRRDPRSDARFEKISHVMLATSKSRNQMEDAVQFAKSRRL